ncbi:MAG: hypothetical protein NTU61_03655 [Candidatus Altiarchaeota archaeon]|nr:hypothetical protein [Candidatus Altiarchaeota archaeon]
MTKIVAYVPDEGGVEVSFLARESGMSESEVVKHVKTLVEGDLVTLSGGNVKATAKLRQFREKGYVAAYVKAPAVTKQVVNVKPKQEETTVDADKILKWLVINKEGKIENLESRFKIKKQEKDQVIVKLVGRGDLRVERKDMLLFTRMLYTIVDSEKVREIRKTLGSSEWMDGYKHVFKTRVDIVVDIINEFEYVRVSTLAKYFNTDLEYMKDLGHILQAKNMIRMEEHGGGDATLKRIG